MIEQLLATVVLVVCAVLFARLVIGARRRRRLDAALQSLAGTGRRALGSARSAWRFRAARRSSKQVADEAIRRAREGGTWEGNVYKPKSFRKPPRDKMH
jgi:hypothetical protein